MVEGSVLLCAILISRRSVTRSGVDNEEKMFKSKCCEGESCKCGKPAYHKIAEEFFDDDDPRPRGHGMSTYVCHECFEKIFQSRG